MPESNPTPTRTVEAVDLRTGAAMVLMASASCAIARPSDPALEAKTMEGHEIEPISAVPHGAVVFVEWAGRWTKMLVR